LKSELGSLPDIVRAVSACSARPKLGSSSCEPCSLNAQLRRSSRRRRCAVSHVALGRQVPQFVVVLRRFWLGALIAVGLTGCRLGYELLDTQVSSGGSGSQGSNGTGGVNPSAGGSTASDAGDSGVAASSALGGTGSVATGSGGDSAGAGDSLGDAGQSAAGTGPLGIGGDPGSSGGGTGGGSATGCQPAVSATTWAFDQTVEAWQLSLDGGTSGTLVWTGATGDPSPGALQLDVTISGKQAVRVLLEQTFPDLTGKTLYARVFLDSGSGVVVKPFVQTGASYYWAEGPAVALAAQQWTCLNLDFANPTTGGATIDPTDVRRIGVLVFGATTLRLYTSPLHGLRHLLRGGLSGIPGAPQPNAVGPSGPGPGAGGRRNLAYRSVSAAEGAFLKPLAYWAIRPRGRWRTSCTTLPECGFG
jgi:hypothetical protein